MGANFQRPLMPHPFSTPKKRRAFMFSMRPFMPVLAVFLIATISFFSLPAVLTNELAVSQTEEPKPPFPVTVNPIAQTITEDPEVEALLGETHGTLAAALGLADGAFTWLANLVAGTSVYQNVAGADIAFVDIKAGYREEEVAAAFGNALGWTSKERTAFLKQVHTEEPVLNEGEFVPGTYMVSSAANASYVQQILADRFEKDIKSRYSTSTEELVPLADTLTIASMLERETQDPAEMRLISGIIWNRLWIGMNLQIDATLQYVKASKTNTKSWWPRVVPDDKYLKSEYNTYRHAGLPPGPIASPSTAAVLAALNPIKTDCLFYFHDKYGEMHCTEDYAGHVKLLKKHYGQGK